MQNKDWEHWNSAVREGLIATQVDGRRLRPRELGPAPAPARPLGRAPAGRLFLTVALDPDPGSLLPLPAPLSAQRHRPLRGEDEGRRRARQAANPPEGTLGRAGPTDRQPSRLDR